MGKCIISISGSGPGALLAWIPLNPKPQTLNPKTLTQNPKPQTLNMRPRPHLSPHHSGSSSRVFAFARWENSVEGSMLSGGVVYARGPPGLQFPSRVLGFRV